VLGGSASYASVSASFFSPVRLVGIVGEDFPKKHLTLFKQRQIDTTGLDIVKNGKTFRWTGRYHDNFSGRDTLEIQLNVFETFRPILPDIYRKTPYVLLSNIDPDLQLSVLDQITTPRFVAADTMNLWLDIKLKAVKELISRIDLIVMNDEEAEQYTGKKNAVEAGRDILKSGIPFVVIKKGAHGALLFSKKCIFPIPAVPLAKVIDPTGAGDCFIGGLMGYLAGQGKSDFRHLQTGVVHGTIAASCCVENFSLNRLRKVSSQELGKRFKLFQNQCRF